MRQVYQTNLYKRDVLILLIHLIWAIMCKTTFSLPLSTESPPPLLVGSPFLKIPPGSGTHDMVDRLDGFTQHSFQTQWSHYDMGKLCKKVG